MVGWEGIRSPPCNFPKSSKSRESLTRVNGTHHSIIQIFLHFILIKLSYDKTWLANMQCPNHFKPFSTKSLQILKDWWQLRQHSLNYNCNQHTKSKRVMQQMPMSNQVIALEKEEKIWLSKKHSSRKLPKIVEKFSLFSRRDYLDFLMLQKNLP